MNEAGLCSEPLLCQCLGDTSSALSRGAAHVPPSASVPASSATAPPVSSACLGASVVRAPDSGASHLLEDGALDLDFGFESEFDFCPWISSLPRLRKGARIPFSHFILSTFPLCRDKSLHVSTALFPLPIPLQALGSFQRPAQLPQVHSLCHHGFELLACRQETCFAAESAQPPSEIQAQVYASGPPYSRTASGDPEIHGLPWPCTWRLLRRRSPARRAHFFPTRLPAQKS